MGNIRQQAMPSPAKPDSKRQCEGFTLIELMVAMAIFMVIGGAAISLVRKHVPLVSSQQNQVGLNIAMRNAVAQMQIDVINAGTGYYQGVNIPAFPIGVTIQNNYNPPGTTNSCYDSVNRTYGANCFDTLHVISTDPSTPPANPSDIGANCVSTTSSSLFANPTGTTTNSQLASFFHSGDQLLLVKSDGSQMATVVLTSDGQVTGGKVKLAHNPTGANGTTNDPLGIANTADSNKLGTQFCTTDWILRLSAITYSVDASNPADPKLVRTQNGATSVIADQIVGFKVGASIWNGSVDQPYNFNAAEHSVNNAVTPCTVPPAQCGYDSDWSTIRAVRISLIGRSSPISDPNSTFRNTFDGGPYKVQGVSVVVNPRNLSMNDN